MTAVLPEVGRDNVGDQEWYDGERWANRASCRGRDLDDFFPTEYEEVADERGEIVDVVEVEPPYPTLEAKRICFGCEVRADCLAWALNMDIREGTYGGMSGFQRQQLTRRKPRKRCPGCGGEEIDVRERNEICVACGVSWDRGLLDDEDV
jgi:Transcription factor WhiB